MTYVQLTAPSIMALFVRPTSPNLQDPDAPPLVLSSAATAIIVGWRGRQFLVTAGHVVTGRHAISGQPLGMGATPRNLAVRLTHQSLWNAYYWINLPLWNNENTPMWLEHPRGPAVDVVAVPIPDRIWFCNEFGVIDDYPPNFPGFAIEGTIRPEAVWRGIDRPLAPISLDVADELSVVGYPFGITGGNGLAVWNRGFIATELQFDHDGLPMYLIDSRTRPGQSGAPVVFFSRSGMYPTGNGVAMGLGDHLLRYMGIYSGRVHDQSDLGRVYKVSAVIDVLDRGQHPQNSLD